MSRMSDLDIQIQELLDQGQTPFMIAQMLDVPISWVYEVEQGETMSPFDTVNS